MNPWDDPVRVTVAAPPRPAVVAVHMGYGHLRAALALAEAAGTDVLSMDRAPYATSRDISVWDRLRTTYERLSRRTGLAVVGPAYRRILEVATAIPRLKPAGTQHKPSLSVRYLGALLGDGFGAPLVAHLKATGAPLVSTFYAAAIVAEAAGHANVVSVITDADVNRVWAPADAERGTTVYAVPTARAARRLRAFGVPAARIHRTGFPLPREVREPPTGPTRNAGRSRPASCGSTRAARSWRRRPTPPGPCVPRPTRPTSCVRSRTAFRGGGRRRAGGTGAAAGGVARPAPARRHAPPDAGRRDAGGRG